MSATGGPAGRAAPDRSGGWLHRVCRTCATIGGTLLLVCALITVADIVGRRTLGWSVPGLIDLTQLLIMGSVFLCIPFTFEQRGNVEVELLFDRLPPAAQRVLAALWSLLGAAFLAAIVWHAGRAASQVLEYGESAPTLGVPMVWYWAPILFGASLAAVVCLAQALRRREKS